MSPPARGTAFRKAMATSHTRLKCFGGMDINRYDEAFVRGCAQHRMEGRVVSEAQILTEPDKCGHMMANKYKRALIMAAVGRFGVCSVGA